MHKFVNTNGIRLHYLEHESKDVLKPVIIFLHGLTANAHSFDSIIHKINGYRIIAVDLRGRGLSDKPQVGYSMEDHAKDILGLMEALNIKVAVIGGHSFGALLSIFLAAHYPKRVLRTILIDAAARLHPKVKEMVTPSMLRLGQTWNSFDAYLEMIKNAPYLNEGWLPEMEGYYRADIKTNVDGTVTSQSSLSAMTLAIEGALSPGENWLDYIKTIEQPSLLINGTEPYGPSGEPILPEELALETVHMMKNCKYKNVTGNHLTMLFGKGAKESVVAIENFLNNNECI